MTLYISFFEVPGYRRAQNLYNLYAHDIRVSTIMSLRDFERVSISLLMDNIIFNGIIKEI